MRNPKSLSQITKELLAAHNLFPKKRLGQNFLTDPGVLRRIIAAAELTASDIILEIGTGLGVLTEELVKKAAYVYSLEVDPDMILIAKNILKKYNNLEIIRKSILEYKLPPDLRSFKIVGNLPYYITAPIIEEIAGEWKHNVSLAVLTIQKEVAQRIVAKPGSKTYGSFSIFVQNQAEVAIDSFVSKSSFYPPPEVTSAILVLKPLRAPRFDIDYRVVRSAFSQRRKTLRNSLLEYNFNWEKIGIDSKRRPETLSLEEFSRFCS